MNAASFQSVEKIADAVLYEGYILYPYRQSSTKNQQRWNFGTLYPRQYAEAQRPKEPYRFVSECLMRVESEATLNLRIRFLQLIRDETEWERGEARSHNVALRISDQVTEVNSFPFQFDSPQSLNGMLTIEVGNLSNVCKLRLELQNLTPAKEGAAHSRAEALLRSFVSAHLLLEVEGGEFISLLNPQEQFKEAAASCHNAGVFPVLVGNEEQRSMMLCSPIILYDYPQVAPESAGDFFDGTEMDEMLALRVLTLTETEKQEMKQCDAYGRNILDRTETLPQEHLLKVHGAIRGMRRVQENEP
jgi:hypothetical protein